MCFGENSSRNLPEPRNNPGVAPVGKLSFEERPFAASIGSKQTGIALCLYNGTHTPLVSRELFEQVQDLFRGHNRAKYRKHEFAFAGLLTCAHDNCTITAEIKRVGTRTITALGIVGNALFHIFGRTSWANAWVSF